MSAPPPPTQAVVLAGGRGTRLGPLTDDRPKPMVEFHGRPFLEYLIEMLRDQGIERVELLLGYRPEVVQDHFGDGSRFGLDIGYSVSGADDLTVSRLRLVEERLDPCFLLLYCDNYWPMRFDDMWHRFATADKLTCWAGLTPRHRESDTKVHRGRITKQGSTMVRWAAVESVQRLPKTSRLGGFRDQVAVRRGRNIAIVAAARRQLEFVFYALRDHHVRALHAPGNPARPAA